MKRKKKKIVKSQMLSLKGKIEKYLTKEDYYDLFNKRSINNIKSTSLEMVSKEMNEAELIRINNDNNYHRLNHELIIKIINKLKNNKSSGPSNITNEYWK